MTTMPTSPLREGADLYARILRDFGHTQYHPFQRDCIKALIEDHRDLLAVLPTGSGKSLIYQGVAKYNGDLMIVVSPLKALMKDQVDKLASIDLSAAYINSDQDHRQQALVFERVRSGQVRVLYVSPERVLTPAFLAAIGPSRVDYVVIDEAHCISQWGHDFRPDYKRLSRLRLVYDNATIAAFTATATPEVRSEIISVLGLDDAAIYVGDFDRPNLNLSIVARTDLADQLLRQAVYPHTGQHDHAGIIYCATRSETVGIAEALRVKGYPAAAYHAGMADPDRRDVQDRFMADKIKIVVATIAFGMGVDKPDVRYVVHTCMPSSIESYHQEIGRAGRDGQPADCIMFAHHRDAHVWQQRFELTELENNLDPDITQARNRSVEYMDSFCHGGGCLHNLLVQHFGGMPRHGMSCHHCSRCHWFDAKRSR